MILITGATGTLGGEVVRQLSAKGVDFRAAVHSISKAIKIKALGGEVVEIDSINPDTVPFTIDIYYIVSIHPRATEWSPR